MTNMIRRGVAAVAFACVSFAHPLLAQERVPVHAHFSRAGLDLANPHDRAIFDARLRRAAAHACTSVATRGINADEARCRDEMMRDGAAQLAALIDHQGARLASIAR